MKDYPYPMQARNEALCPFTRDTQLSGFLTLPKSLLCWGLSPGALLVYGLLLDRGKLSQRSGWTPPTTLAGCWRRWSGAAGSFPQPRPVPAPGRLRAPPVQFRTGEGPDLGHK